MLIDTHCHLNDTLKFPDPGEEIRWAGEVGVKAMILVGVRPEEWETTVSLTRQYSECFSILGWHPNYTKEMSLQAFEPLRTLATDPKCLAIGEIGLDYHWDYSPKETQFQALEIQLDLASELGLPVVFHAREAYRDLLDLLESRPIRPYLLHCFAGNQSEAERAVALGCFFGVDGPITYKKSDELRSVLKTLPLDRIVLETDAPYLTPVPHRGKPNRPAFVPLINQALADLHGMTPEETASKTTENAIRFFYKMVNSQEIKNLLG